MVQWCWSLEKGFEEKGILEEEGLEVVHSYGSWSTWFGIHRFLLEMLDLASDYVDLAVGMEQNQSLVGEGHFVVDLSRAEVHLVYMALGQDLCCQSKAQESYLE